MARVLITGSSDGLGQMAAQLLVARVQNHPVSLLNEELNGGARKIGRAHV